MLDESIIKLYHGTANPEFLPVYNHGRDYHDYGNGFYCTQDIALAQEWACQRVDTDVAYVYEYEFHNSAQFRILDLNAYEPIVWIAILSSHRWDADETRIVARRREELIAKYSINCAEYDAVYGFRADDKYFAILRRFLTGTITYETMTEAIKLGNLGQQFVVISAHAYDALTCVNRIAVTGADYAKFRSLYTQRDKEARTKFDALDTGEGRLITDFVGVR